MGGPDESLSELVGQVLGFDGHLARHIQRDRIGAMIFEDPAQPAAPTADTASSVAVGIDGSLRERRTRA